MLALVAKRLPIGERYEPGHMVRGACPLGPRPLLKPTSPKRSGVRSCDPLPNPCDCSQAASHLGHQRGGDVVNDVWPDSVGLGPLVEGQPAPPAALVAVGQRAIVPGEQMHVIG